jgi:hypothetical protein
MNLLLSRFTVVHAFRFFKQPSAGPPFARATFSGRSCWTCLVAAANWQLWLARPLLQATRPTTTMLASRA